MRIFYPLRLLLALTVLFGGATSLSAATIKVTNTSDDPDAPAEGSLRQAIRSAAAGDTIVFAASTNGTPIVLGERDDESPAFIVLNKDLTIIGNGMDRTIIDGDGSTRIFSVRDAVGAEVKITKLTIRNGSTTTIGGGVRVRIGHTLMMTDVKVLNCVATRGGTFTSANGTSFRGGGGIANEGTLMLKHCLIDGNSASGPGGEGVAAGSGGGILNAAGASLMLERSTVSNNTANRAGGGIEDVNGGSFVIRRSFITDNTVNSSPGNGGGIHLSGAGSLSIYATEVTGNTAGSEGGGIWLGTGTLTTFNTLIQNNEAMGAGATNGGGGLYNDGGTMAITTRTNILDNQATGAAASGGGIFNADGGTLSLANSVVRGNSANRAGGGIEDASGAGSPFTVMQTDIDGNQALGNPEVTGAPGNGGGIHVGGDGELLIMNAMVRNNTAAAEGGGVWIGTGELTVNNSKILDNSAAGDDATEGGGGLYGDGGTMRVNFTEILGNQATGAAGSGGGILNALGGTLIVSSAIIDRNVAARAGAGIEDASGSTTSMVVLRSDIRDNILGTSPGNGAGIHVGAGGNSFIIGGRILRNSAGSEGGGVWNDVGTMVASSVIVSNNNARGNEVGLGGGGFYNNGGTLILRNCTLNSNQATGVSGSGGGVLSSGGFVQVRRGSFTSNTAPRAGGGVEIFGGNFQSIVANYNSNIASSNPGNGGAFHVSSTESTISFIGGVVQDNSASNQGAGLWNQAGSTMSLLRVSVTDNNITGGGEGAGGGGLYNEGGTLIVRNSTIATNSAVDETTNGGGILNASGGTLTLRQSTISTNTTGGEGGGVYNLGTASVENATIALNTADNGGGYAQAVDGAATTLLNTALSDNVGTTNPDISISGGTITSGGYNLVSDDSSGEFPATATDIEGQSGNFGPLQNNGGATLTHEPNCPSPVVDAGNPNDERLDQIGQSVFGDQRDIGAFEKQSACGAGLQQSDPFGSSAGIVAEEESVRVFPNPTYDVAVVRLPASLTTDRAVLTVLSAEGRVVAQRVNVSGTERLDVSSYAPGTYTLRVVAGDQVQIARFVVVQ